MQTLLAADTPDIREVCSTWLIDSGCAYGNRRVYGPYHHCAVHSAKLAIKTGQLCESTPHLIAS